MAPKAASSGGATRTDEAAVRALVDAWLEAQNSGEFARYESLYAPRFEGVRRSGAQTARLDRARWMKERAAMFERKMTVTAKDVAIQTTSDGAIASFVQTWASGAYRDEGPKRMVFTTVDGKLRIAREEMLSSMVLSSSSLDPESFAFALHLPTPHLVLDTSPKKEWTKGDPTVVSLENPVVTRKDTDAGSLPSKLAAWSGKKVELFGSSGVVCEGTVGKLSVVARVIPHFGTMNEWTSSGDYAGQPKPPIDEVARQAWDLASGLDESGRALVGEVRPEKGDCKGALWGRVVQADKPVVVAGTPADAATKQQALAELRKTKAYAALQKRYESEKEPAGPVRWEDFEPNLKVLIFDHPKAKIVTLSLRAGAGCATFGGTLSSVWEQKGGKLVAIADPSGEELAPLSAGDVDGDGKIDLVLDQQGLIRWKGGQLGAVRKLAVPMLDCGC